MPQFRKLRVRKVAPILMGAIIGGSAIPWFRRQHLFEVLVGLAALTLFCFIVFRGIVVSFGMWRVWRERGYVKFPLKPRRGYAILTGVGIFLLIILVLPHYLVTTSGAYKLAIETARRTQLFTDILGAPVTEAWFSDGKIELSHSGKADLLIPVQGSVRNGNLRVLAVKDNGVWQLKTLTLEVKQPPEAIDLLSNKGLSNSHEAK